MNLPIIDKKEEHSNYIRRCMFELCVNGDHPEDEAFYMCDIEYKRQIQELNKPKNITKDADTEPIKD
jgi:hypothetical protein